MGARWLQQMRAQRPYKTYVSPPVTATDASPMTVAIQSCQSWCQELVLWQAQRLAFDIVDNLTLHRTHKVIYILVSMNPSQVMLHQNVILR